MERPKTVKRIIYSSRAAPHAARAESTVMALLCRALVRTHSTYLHCTAYSTLAAPKPPDPNQHYRPFTVGRETKPDRQLITVHYSWLGRALKPPYQAYSNTSHLLGVSPNLPDKQKSHTSIRPLLGRAVKPPEHDLHPCYY